MEQQGSPAQAASVGGLGAAALVALACGTTLGNVGGNVMPALLAGFGERFSLTDTAAGMVAAAQLLATAVVTLLLAARASRSGRVQLARIGLIVATIGFAAAWLSPTVAILVGANVAAGAGLGAVFAAGTAALGSTPDVDRATFRTVLVATLATAALILAVSFANEAGGGTAGFAVLAACCAFGLWGVRGLPERPGDHAAETGPRPSLLFLAAVLAFGVVEQGTWSYAAVFGMRHAGLAEGAASLALSVAALAALVGVPLGTFASLRLGRVVALVGVALLEFAARNARRRHRERGRLFGRDEPVAGLLPRAPRADSRARCGARPKRAPRRRDGGRRGAGNRTWAGRHRGDARCDRALGPRCCASRAWDPGPRAPRKVRRAGADDRARRCR